MKSLAGTTVIYDSETQNGKILRGWKSDSGSPAATANVYAPGALITETVSGTVYRNNGTSAAPTWEDTGSIASSEIDPTVVQAITVNLTAADLIDTAAGKLSHANGLIVVPAAATGYVNVLVSATVSYTFATAAFTGGGNTTFNIGAGGAALTGLIATTTLWQNASSIIHQFVPLSTVAFPITKETSINLKTASAITNPGTAAGSAKVTVLYRVLPI